MSITNINDYLNSISALSTSMVQSSVQRTATSSSSDSDQDSYISSITDSSDPLVSDNYNDILQKLASALTTSSTSESSSDSTGSNATSTSADSSTSASASSASATAGTSGSSSDDSSSSETETEVVTINGVTYLQTTTTENGVETVTRTVISAGDNEQSDDLLSLLKNEDSQTQTQNSL